MTSTGWESDLYRFVDEAHEVDPQTTTGLHTSDYCFDVKRLFVSYVNDYSFVPDTTIAERLLLHFAPDDQSALYAFG